MPESAPDFLLARLERLNAIGIALSSERDPTRLLELILLGAKDLTLADAGTLYRVSADAQQLDFAILRNDSLHLAMGGSSGVPITLPSVPLHTPAGQPNQASVVAHAVLTRATVNIADAYHAEGFDFAGTRAFDQRTGYRSTSFLTVPMTNHENEIVGVLQLINARDATGQIVAFSPADQKLVESLASQAATVASQYELIAGMRALFEALVKLIATAIDEKSPYTGGHCRRVPELTMLLAEAAHRTRCGPLAGFTLSDADRYELRIAAWLHDCGKLTTPDWVMDKPTKLSAPQDRIELIALRFGCAKAQAELAHWRALHTGAEAAAPFFPVEEQLRQLDDDLAFLRRCNTGGEFMSEAHQQRVQAIAAQTWLGPDGRPQPLLEPDEVTNLLISKGTLNAEERSVINHHIVVTQRMLESLPYPKHLRRVPEYAGGHHERMDGRGYPNGLTRDELSVPARMMGLADVFEALTAGDRPYKKAYTLSQALHILGTMKVDGHFDPDLFEVFMREGVWRDYAERYLPRAQIDAVDLTKIPGFTP
jgi:HD-GYP domain-containing protein (c-di-GMP phosphodiesterase class II)